MVKLLIWATSTITHTVSSVTTGTTTSTTVETTTVTATAVASRRWEEQREVLDILLRRASPRPSSTTASNKATPSYAKPCASIAAYSSACSCLGVRAATITAPTPQTTKTINIQKSATITEIATILTTESYTLISNTTNFNNSTKAHFADSTIPPSTSLSLSSVDKSGSAHLPSVGDDEVTTRSDGADSSSLLTSESQQSSAAAPATSSPGISLFPNSTTSARFVNATSSNFGNSSATALFQNSTTSISVLNATSTRSFVDTTSAPSVLNAAAPLAQINVANTTTAPFLNTTSATGLQNVTASAPFLNATSNPFLNVSALAPSLNVTTAPYPNGTTSLPFLNATSEHYLDTTSAPYANGTTAALSLNATSAHYLNTTSPPYANATSVRYSNTSSVTATAMATSTLDTSCGETSTPFLLQVTQPSSAIDGWYARIIGNQILFGSSANQSGKFSVESSGHLCAVGLFGESGSPAIAIVETKEGLSGSAVYFVDGQRLTNLTEQGYGALDCAVDDDLACQAQGLAHWVGCGLGLDISSDGNENVVVDASNCTSLGLSAVYE